MILIGLGSNVTGPWGTPGGTLARAMGELDRLPVRLERASSIISTEPWGKADQPVYANAVARVRTRMQPLALLAHCVRWSGGRGVSGASVGVRAPSISIFSTTMALC
jgi:2-amino-4-hydroxy-6-hydroxymethyldihydropteridine diphosphokinase